MLKRIAPIIVSLLCLHLLGCTENEKWEEYMRIPPTTIIPEFHLKNFETEGSVVLDTFSMGVGEIRLEPLGDPLGNGADEAIYVTRNPFNVELNISEGNTVFVGEPILLPHGGDFMISLRVEPLDNPATFREELVSVSIEGQYARYITPNLNNHRATGDSFPIIDSKAQDPANLVPPVRWISWFWDTQEVGLVVLNDVRFSDNKEQKLIISLDLDNWLQESVAPIQVTVEESETSPVNVSERLERSLGSGFDQLHQEFYAETP